MPNVRVYNKLSFKLEFVNEEIATLDPNQYHINPDLSVLEAEALKLDPATYQGGLFLNKFHLVDGVLVFKDTEDLDAIDATAFIYQKEKLLDELDQETAAKIEAGTFTHAGKEFSLTTTAQIKWLGILNAKDTTTYPQTVFTKDNSEVYNIADADEVVAMYSGIFTAVKALVDAGTVAKEGLIATTTLEDAELAVQIYLAS